MDIFNLNAEDLIKTATQRVRVIDEDIFDPDVSQGQNGVYKAVIRFIPWHAATSIDEIMYKKYMVKLSNPVTREKVWFDDPSTIGKSSAFWTLDIKLKALEKEEPELVKDVKKNFSRSYKYYSLIYIKKDPQNPHLEGKIKIAPYGYQIQNLIDQQINPQDQELGMSQKVNPFSLTEGKDFIYVAKKKTEFWRDFSACKFMDQTSPLIIKSGDKEIAITSDPKMQAKVKEFLIKNSPDLSKHFYKPWTDETYAKAVQFLKAAINKPILDSVMNECRDTVMVDLYRSAPSALSSISASSIKTTSLDDDFMEPVITKSLNTDSRGIDFDISEPTSKTETKTKPKAKDPAPVASDDDDMFADL